MLRKFKEAYNMFHKVNAVVALSDYILSVQFAEGIIKVYDVKPLLNKHPAFQFLKDNPELFTKVKVDKGGYGIVWNDDLDLSCNELFANGITIN